jgi:hypothetical protein
VRFCNEERTSVIDARVVFGHLGKVFLENHASCPTKEAVFSEFTCRVEF